MNSAFMKSIYDMAGIDPELSKYMNIDQPRRQATSKQSAFTKPQEQLNPQVEPASEDVVAPSIMPETIPNNDQYVDNRTTTPSVNNAAQFVQQPASRQIQQPVIQDGNGYITGAQRYDLPQLRHGARDKTNGLVVHRTAGRGFHTPNDPRALKGGLGAHLTIDRNGNVHQIGNLDDKMWHAGPGYNGNSVGIELTGKHLGGDKWEELTPLQQSAFLRVGGDVIKKYGIKKDNIYNHANIAAKTAGEGLVAKNYLIDNYGWGN